MAIPMDGLAQLLMPMGPMGMAGPTFSGQANPNVIGGLGAVPGMGQVPGMEMKGPPSKEGAASLDAFAKGIGSPAEGMNPMASILGMEALKGIQQGAREAGARAPAPGPVAPRPSGKVEQEQVKATSIDPRIYMMALGGGK